MALAVQGILVWKNGRIDNKDKRLFYITYLTIAIALFAEWLGVQLDGKEGFSALPLYITKCADYILTPMSAAAFALLMNLRNIWSKILQASLAFNAVFQIIAAVFGLVFVIDEHNHYTKGPLYYAYFGFCLFVLAIIIIQFFLYSRMFPRRNKASLYAVFVLVVTGVVMQELLPGSYRTAYLALALGASYLFINFAEFHQMRTDKVLERQKILIEKDTLTGLNSRFAYNQELQVLNKKLSLPDDFAVFVIDINGLKTVNDAFGHSAGDELIVGAATCISNVMDKYSHCFRIGGDEFVVLTTLSKEQAKNKKRLLRKEASGWKGLYSRHLSMAVGYVLAGDFPDATAEQLVSEADKRMYDSKIAYYEEKEEIPRFAKKA